MRPKANMRYEIIRELRDDAFKSDVRADFIIRLTNAKSRKLYPDELRLVKVLDPESGELMTFITNNLDFYPQEIANIYRHRWDIEVFFKWIKQNITIKSLWGYSENAVKTHLWVAITAYLLLAKIKANTKSPYSITEVATLIRVSALEKTELRKLLTRPIDSFLSNQNVKELTLFNNL
jgi:IS4 transposase